MTVAKPRVYAIARFWDDTPDPQYTRRDYQLFSDGTVDAFASEQNADRNSDGTRLDILECPRKVQRGLIEAAHAEGWIQDESWNWVETN